MNRHRAAGPSKATATTLCQKCYQRGHYSFECTKATQERPYIPRPSRTQQILNPKLVPKLNTDVMEEDQTKRKPTASKPNTNGKRTINDTSHEIATMRKRSRSASMSSLSSDDSVSSISTNRSPSPPPRRKRKAIKYSRSPDPTKASRRSRTSPSKARAVSRNGDRDHDHSRGKRYRSRSYSPVQRRGRERRRSSFGSGGRSESRSLSRDRYAGRRNGRGARYSRSRSPGGAARAGAARPGRGAANGREKSRSPFRRERMEAPKVRDSIEDGEGRRLSGSGAGGQGIRDGDRRRDRGGILHGDEQGRGQAREEGRWQARDEGRMQGREAGGQKPKERSLSPYSRRVALTQGRM